MSKQIESITFFSCLREALALSLDNMEGLQESEKSSLQSFILSESTDYEVMHFSITGKFPSEKYNSVNEAILVDTIKNELTENYIELIESGNYTEETLDNLIESLIPLTENGLSSSTLILEHLSSTGILPLIISEKWYDKFLPKKDKTTAKKSDIPKGISDASDAMTGQFKQAGKMKNPIMGKKGSPAGSDTPAIIKAAGNATMDGDGTVKKPESAAKGAISLKKLGTAAGVTVAIAALLYGGYKTYKRFLSKAAKACSNKSGAEKTACMVAFKKNAVKAQIADLRRGLSGCSGTKNPQKCKAAINAKIQKLQSKVA